MVRRALPQLTQRWRVYALVRRRDPALAALGVTQLIGDLDQAHTLRRLRGIAQAVIHSAPPPGFGDVDLRTQRLISKLGGGRTLLQRLVYISTTGVYGNCSGAQIDETRRLAPMSDRALRRVDAERRLRMFGLRNRCRVSIVRAPGIYAADRLPIERLRNRLPLLDPGDDVYTNHINAVDLANACIAALRNGRANRTYNVCDDSDVRMGDWYDKLADRFLLPRAPRLPRDEAEKILPPMQRSFMCESRRIGNARLKRELKFCLQFPTVDDGIRAAFSGGVSCSG